MAALRITQDSSYGMSLFLAVNIVCVLYLQLAYCDSEYYHTVYIDSSNGRDNETCIVSNNSMTRPCQSLHWALKQEYRGSSTQYILLNSGPHRLFQPIEDFLNLSSIAFIGSEVNTTIHCMAAETGLAFIDITDLVFVNITFIGCASERTSTSRNFSVTDEYVFSTVQVSLYFYHCHNVRMNNVRVESPGFGATGVIMYDSDGVNTIANSHFVNCTVEPDHPGGGGFYVEFSYCVPGNTSCFNNNSNDVVSYESRNKGAEYHFLNCTFRQNIAKDTGASKRSTYIIANRGNHEAFGRGGGLSIFIKGNASDNIFNISMCMFDLNLALWGGGLFMEFQDDTFNNTITVNHSTFSDNNCHFTTHSGTGGGGMRIGHFENPEAFHDIINNIILMGCHFSNNSALNGGGLSVHSSLKHKSVANVSTIHVMNSVFSENVARLGAAMYINPFSIFNAGQTLSVYIVQCNFTNNSNQYVHRIKEYWDQPYEIGVGAVYINKVDVYFQDKLTFSNNSGSALAVVGTAVNFRSNCEADFSLNTGIEGGAIALLGAAYIQIGDNVTIKFNENKASSKGGAIYNKYVEKEDIKTDLNCFFQHENPLRSPNEWNAHFHFYGNKHQGGLWPNAIYSTSLLPCSWNGDDGISNTLIFCNKQQWHFTAECSKLLSSDVGKIKYTGDGEIKNHVQAYPGKPFHLPIRVQDDLSNSIKLGQTIFSVSTNYSDSSNTSEMTNNFVYFWGESATLNEAANKDIALKLYSIGDRVWHVEVLVNMQSCPPGFKPVQSSIENTVCNCSNDYSGTLICDDSLFRSYLKNGHWMGKIPGHGDDYLVGQCPPSYCASSRISMHIPLPSTEEELEKLICGEQNRQGVLCGKCLEEFGLAVNSLAYNSSCVSCNETEVNVISNVAKYIASIYIPLFVLFTILILFDIRLTTGPANAFILYCQVVASTFDLNADGQIPLNKITNISTQLLQAYRVPYGIFNLEFLENFLDPLCFGADFNMLSVLSLDYIVALFPLIMILVVIICVKLHACISLKCQYSKRSKFSLIDRAIETCRRNTREAILPAFATFLLLSYTKFSIVSSYLIKYQPLVNENGTRVQSTTYYAGEVVFSYSQSYPLRYFLPATIVLATFVLITPLLLLDYPLRVFEWVISRRNFLWRFYPVDKVHVLLDTFQGCYKNKMRFFAGLYFLFRMTVNVSYIFTTWLEQYMIQQLACIIMIVLLAVFQPYNEKNKILNYVDILIFANLAVLNAFSYYMYSIILYNPMLGPPTTVFVFQYFLVFLPLIYMVGYVIRSVAKTCFLQLKLRKNNSQFIEPATTVDSQSEITSQQEYSEIEAILERAEEKNLYRPSRNQLRENSSSKWKTGETLHSSLRAYGSTDNTKVSA